MEFEGRGEGDAGAAAAEAAEAAATTAGREGAEGANPMEEEEEEAGGEGSQDDGIESSSASEPEYEGMVGVSGNESDDEGAGEPEISSAVSPIGIDVDAIADPELRKRKKKKKKKKKKKITKDVAELDHFAALEAQMLPPEIADKRYSSSLESMRTDDSMIWMQLSRCRITDKKARKLFAALKDNTTLTSLDLSENLLTDESLQSLARVLSAGLAPNLIYVDVRANPISSKSQDALDRLRNLRRHLKVDFHLQTFDHSVGNGGRADDDDWVEGYAIKNKWVANGTENGGSSPSWGENAMAIIQPRLCSPEVLQEKVELALLSIKKSSTSLHVSGLASSLREIIINFSQQLSHNRADNMNWETVEQLPRGLPLLLEKIGVFLSVLDMSPAPILCQRKLEEQSAGMHRIALVELLNLLLVPGSSYIEEKLLAEGTPARLVSLFFQFPWNSILQGAVVRSLQAMLGKPSLRPSLLEGSSGLASSLSKAGKECAALPMGKRPGYGGYIVRLSKEVELLAEKDAYVQNVLVQNEEWTRYVGPGGALKKMVAEQTGHLGGPKPTSSRAVTQFFQNENGKAVSTLDQLRGLFLP